MFTSTDVLIIVVATIVFTTICISCMTANVVDEKQSKAYWKGYLDGKKVGKHDRD